MHDSRERLFLVAGRAIDGRASHRAGRRTEEISSPCLDSRFRVRSTAGLIGMGASRRTALASVVFAVLAVFGSAIFDAPRTPTPLSEDST